ncbi:hypothetical protein W822_14715 [Advenella kashmirensis W13003]|uniref:DUF596 domain-containing protein n=1 Tax=Advenella kashmirensis W13003 TaxID=1424334 RepID=V8QPY1_9BURK|nr:DUF596 domain-containing protein [Advenella kashmirensis]ETF02011.1 hypothetical protein W822_14715 [Advenella kashmirensis W13003]
MKIYEDIPENVMTDLLEAVEGSSADAMWTYIREDIPGVSSCTYDERRNYYLSVMYQLMKAGRLKIAFNNTFWEGTIEEQLQRYSDRWPNDENCLFKADFQLIENPDDGGLYFWAKGCFVWIYEDGFEEWTN